MLTPLDQKRCTAEEAVALIGDGKTLASGGFVGAAHPEALTAALEQRFLTQGSPRNLTLVYAAGQGDGKDRGLNHLAHEGLIKRVIGGHWSLAPKMGRLAIENKIEAYNFPQGVLCQLFRDIAGGRPGCITHIGLGTFIDPVNEGGTLNKITPRAGVERIELGGKTWLWYKSFPIHVAIVRGTAADPFGNIVMDDEVILGEARAMALAAHNSGGIVIAQVARFLDAPAEPKSVVIPGIIVNKIVLADAKDHGMTFAEPFNERYITGAPDAFAMPAMQKLALDERRIIAVRACDELPEGAIANLGIGMPEGVARIAAERSLLHRFTLTLESGPIGGMPAGGLSFGAAVHPQAIVDQPSQFDFYDGRALDFSALGLAQMDAHGNVNVSKFGTRLAGVGGFVNISQTARTLVFCGTLTAGDLQIRIDHDAGGEPRVVIVKEGPVRKFVSAVEQVSFSAARSREIGQRVLYVTERAVFQLTDAGVELIEVAPGIDIERDIVSQMAFRPIVKNVRPMPRHCFVVD